MMSRVNTFALTMIAALAVATVTVVGQDNRQDQGNRLQQAQQTQQPMSRQANTGGVSEATIANCIVAANQNEVALGKLAEQHAKSNDVKQFAQEMVKDHTNFEQKLNRWTQAGNQQQSAQGTDFVAIKRQIDQHLLDLVRKDLEDKQGTQFDKCYIGSQIGEHMQMLAALEVLRNHVSSDLASVIDNGIQTTKTHLERAQKLAKELDQGSNQETAQRDSGRRND